MVIIKKGTYRLKDKLTIPDTKIREDNIEFSVKPLQIEITQEIADYILEEYGVLIPVGDYVITYSFTGIELIVENVTVPFIDYKKRTTKCSPYNEFIEQFLNELNNEVYHDDRGWDTQTGEDNQTITITKDAEVSDAFNNWFTENTEKKKFTKLVKNYPLVNGTVTKCTVLSGNTIAAGDFVDFQRLYSPRTILKTENLEAVSMKKLEENYYLLFYAPGGASGNTSVWACVVFVDGKNITLGTAAHVIGSVSDYAYVASYVLPDGRILVFSCSEGVMETGETTAKIYTREGMTLTKQVERTFMRFAYNGVYQLSAEKYLARTRSGSSAKVVSVTGESIVLGETVALPDNIEKGLVLNESQVLYITRESDAAYATIITVDEMTVLVGEKIKITESATDSSTSFYIKKWSDNKFVVIYKKSGSKFCAVFLTINETLITVESTVQLDLNTISTAPGIYWLSSTKALLLYNTAGNKGAASVLKIIAEGEITQGEQIIINSGDPLKQIGATVLAEDKVIATFLGCAQTLNINDVSITTAAQEVVFQSNPADTDYTASCYKLALYKKSPDTVEVFYYIVGERYLFSTPYTIKVASLTADGNNIIVNETKTKTTKVKKAVNDHAEGVAKTSGTSKEAIEVYRVK